MAIEMVQNEMPTWSVAASIVVAAFATDGRVASPAATSEAFSAVPIETFIVLPPLTKRHGQISLSSRQYDPPVSTPQY